MNDCVVLHLLNKLRCEIRSLIFGMHSDAAINSQTIISCVIKKIFEK